MKLSQKVFYLTLIGVLCGFMLTAGDYTTKQQTRDVIVVFKTHFDIGYTDWADNVRYNYAGPMVEGALEIVEKSHQMPEHQQFNWIIAGWPMKEMLENSKPEVKPRIEQAIRNGNFTVHGLPFTFQVDACEPESMVRSLGYSSAINRQAGLQLPIDAKQTDVPSHSWVLPTILANAGIKFLHIGCNPASPSPEVPLLFWWEGPDQSRLMTMYFEPYYGTSPAHGYMSTPCETKLARHLAKDIVNIENMTTLFDVWNIASEPGLHARTKRAMEKIHLFNEHTFGLSMSHGHRGYWAYGNDFEALRARGFYNPIEFSWAEKALHTKKAQQIIKPALARKVKKLALSIKAENERIVVYNPLPWERSGIVTIQTRTNLGDMLRNTSTGELVRLSKDRNIYRFSTNSIPPMGYVTFVPAEVKAADKTLTHHYNQEQFELENDFFRIKIDPADGTIRSIIDKKSGKEFVSSNSEWKFGQYVTERFSKENTDQYAHDYIKSSDHWHWAYPELGRINLTDEPYRRISLDRPGLWKYSTDFIPQKGNVFFNLYNNMWSTNFTYWVEGSWQARFYLWSFDSYSNEQSVITPSEEILNPLLVAYATGKPGNMPLTATGLTLSRKGLQIGAFGPNPDGEGTLLRIWEQSGTGGEATITFPAGSGYRTAQPVNLRGETISNPITVENQQLV